MKHPLLSLLCVLAVVLFLPAAKADTVYTYTGNQFNQWYNGTTCPGVCSISGSFTLSGPFVPFSNSIHGLDAGPGYSGFPLLTDVLPVAYSFSDGVTTLNQSNSTISSFRLGAEFGTLPQWFIDISGGGVEFITFFVGSASESNDEIIQGGALQALLGLPAGSPTSTTCSVLTCAGNPGAWTSATTPEPSSLFLLWAGALGLIGARLKTFRSK